MAALKVPLATPMYDASGKLARAWFLFFNSMVTESVQDLGVSTAFADPLVDPQARAVSQALAIGDAFDDFTPIADPARLARLNVDQTFTGAELFSGPVELEGTLAIGAPFDLTGTPRPVQVTGDTQVTGKLDVSGVVSAPTFNATGGFQIGGVAQTPPTKQPAIASPTLTGTGTAAASYNSATQTLINQLETDISTLKSTIDTIRTELQSYGVTF